MPIGADGYVATTVHTAFGAVVALRVAVPPRLTGLESVSVMSSADRVVSRVTPAATDAAGRGDDAEGGDEPDERTAGALSAPGVTAAGGGTAHAAIARTAARSAPREVATSRQSDRP